MNTIKKLSILGGLSLLVLAGCGNSDADGDTAVVDFYSDKADDDVIYDEISDSIQDDTNLSINYVTYSDTSSFQTSVQQTLGTGDSPGLFTWWSGHQLESLVESGDIVDLSNEWEEYYFDQGVNPDLAEAFTVDGNVYAAPFSVLYSGMFYNVEIFDEYNLEVPTTFEEFLETSEMLVSEGVTPIGTKSDSWASFLWFQQLIGVYNPDLYDELINGETPYNDDEVVEIMQVYKSMIEDGFFAEPVDYPTLSRQFADGDVAMAYEPTLFTIPLENDFGLESEEDYSMFIMPQIEGSEQNTPIFYEAAPIVVSDASPQKDDAIEVLRELYTEESHQIYADHQNSSFVEGVEVENPTTQNVIELTNSDGYDLKIRYYEATPSSIVDTATNSLWEFFYNPSDESIENTLNTIQNEADESFEN